MVILLVSVVGLAVDTWRVRRALDRAERNLVVAHDRANRNLAVARNAVDKFLVETGGKNLRKEPLPEPARRRLLEEALEFYETYLADRPDAAAHENRGIILHALRLAMEKHKLGQKDAREWYDKAVAWMDKHKPDDQELKRVRAEAEEVLGITDGE
ncbi:MAG: hypothetical protein ACYSUM_18170 [Planctomycetota bacterium]